MLSNCQNIYLPVAYAWSLQHSILLFLKMCQSFGWKMGFYSCFNYISLINGKVEELFMYFLITHNSFLMNWMLVAFADFSIELFVFSLLSIKHSLYILMLTNHELEALSQLRAWLSYFYVIFSYIETEILLLVRILILFLYDWCFLMS